MNAPLPDSGSTHDEPSPTPLPLSASPSVNARVGVRVWEVVLLSTMASIVVFLLLLWILPRYTGLWPVTEERPVYVIDGQALIEAKLAAMRASRDLKAGDAELFARDMDQYFNKLGKRGVLVINRRAAIAWPPGSDITEQAARDLNLALSPPPPAPSTAAPLNAAPDPSGSTGFTNPRP